MSIQGDYFLMSLTPGDAYISSWRRPLRSRNSIAEKSLLSRLMLFSNSSLFQGQYWSHVVKREHPTEQRSESVSVWLPASCGILEDTADKDRGLLFGDLRDASWGVECSAIGWCRAIWDYWHAAPWMRWRRKSIAQLTEGLCESKLPSPTERGLFF